MGRRRQLIINLHIPPDEMMKYYQGKACQVHTVSEEGLSLRFPATNLRPFMSHSGIHGRFAIVFDENNKFIDLQKL